MSIIDERQAYKPFEYEIAHQFWELQQQDHWLHFEVLTMPQSVDDWNYKLTEEEKKIIAGVLLGFTQTEVYVGMYWGSKVTKWFPKPEIREMALCFSSTETIHQVAYNYLSDTLGLEEHDAFLQEPTAAAKLNNFIHRNEQSLYDIALSLAVYSGLVEGVSLYSSFAILLSFSKRNLLKGVGEIITWSVRDERLHSTAGCWLYRQLVEEHPYLLETDLEAKIVEAAKITLQLEFDFIDMVFGQYSMEGINAMQVKEFMKHRVNKQLKDLNIGPIYSIDEKLQREVSDWFYLMTESENHTDFFAARVTNYTKGSFDPNKVDWDAAFS